MASAISLRITEPIFESQTKTKLGSVDWDKEKALPLETTLLIL